MNIHLYFLILSSFFLIIYTSYSKKTEPNRALSSNLVNIDDFNCSPEFSTAVLEPFIGDWRGKSKMVNTNMDFEAPIKFLPFLKSVKNRSSFTLNSKDPCHKYHVKIEYLGFGEDIIRTVEFDGEYVSKGSFVLLHKNERKGFLKQLDNNGKTFLASFIAPHPLNKDILTKCDELINISNNDNEVIRTIQCFLLPEEKSKTEHGELAQIRIVKEERVY